MVTNVTEVNGARVVIACMPGGKVLGAAVWESKDKPGKFFSLTRETVRGEVIYQHLYEGHSLDRAVGWATGHINRRA